jgi:uncharacterized protein YbaR (Trm112 family)
MFVELLEQLRCPRSHEESRLIASAARTDARHIVDGILGCPVCGAEFAIRSGITYFDDTPYSPTVEDPGGDTAMRLAAFLELTDARGFAILCGRWGAHADQINRLSQTPLVLVNPPETVAGEIAAIVRIRDTAPFALDTARAVALDERVSPALSASLVRVVQPGGRVIGPLTVGVPTTVTEIVRDDRIWIAEKVDTRSPALVSIRRERPD